MQIHRFLLLFALLLGTQVQAAEPSWTGSWDTRWRDGGAQMELQEADGKVTGQYPAYGGRIEGSVEGRHLTGRWTEGARSGGLDFVLAPDGRTFMGRFDNGEWWTGGRVVPAVGDLVIDQSGAREALRTFVQAGNAARDGSLDEMAKAADVVDFGRAGSSMAPGEKLAAAKNLFDLVDQTTFHLWAIPGKRATGDHLDLTLAQAGTNATLPLTLIKTDQGWFIVDPSSDIMASSRHALLERSGGRLPTPDNYKRRLNPRDAIRSFIGAFSDWDGAGREQALDALDLTRLNTAVRDYEGELAAQYLKGVLDRVGSFVPQEIPDDPARLDPYVAFSHPAGSIIVAAIGNGDHLTWKLNADTVQTARELYIAVEDMPSLSGAAIPAPPSAYFKLRQWVRDQSPALLTAVGLLEVWQILGWAGILVVSFLLALLLSALILNVLRRLIGGRQQTAERDFRWPLWLSITFSIYKLLIPVIGLPETVKRISVGTTGVLLALALMWGGWRLIDIIGDLYFKRSEGSVAVLDNIVVSLAFGALKLVLVACGLIFIAIELSLPYEGVIAGLSIGGLAVAFASKETLSNVFGAGILAIDRPFRRGDWIIAGDTQGTVEYVGIRSTRIRTGEDSLIVVPNGKLSDATVNNLGTRRYYFTKAKLPISYRTRVDQIDCFIHGLRDLIAQVPNAMPEKSNVAVATLGPDKIEMEITLCVDGRVPTNRSGGTGNLMIDILNLGERMGIKFGDQADAPGTEAAKDPPSLLTKAVG